MELNYLQSIKHQKVTIIINSNNYDDSNSKSVKQNDDAFLSEVSIMNRIKIYKELINYCEDPILKKEYVKKYQKFMLKTLEK